MKIIGTMLSGNSEAVVAEAIESVRDWVDSVLLIDTGISDNTIEIAREIAGKKLIVEEFEWCNNFSKARNFSLEMAAKHRGQWALTIDTDERLVFDGCNDIDDLKSKLDQKQILLWLAKTKELNYSKERFIRVPTKLEWRGRTHEALCGSNSREQAVFPHCRFFELEKTDSQRQHKFERDLRILLEETEQQPDNARWWYYLGQTYKGLGLFQKSADAYRRCYELNDWKEQSAWACFCAANALMKIDQLEEALTVSVKGMEIQPASPEIAWQAGFCCYRLGRFEDAIVWEEIAVALGHYEGIKAGENRIGQRNVSGWYDAPFDVMKFAYKKLGKMEKHDEAKRKHAAAKQERLLIQSSNSSVTNEHPQSDLVPVVVMGLYSSGSSATSGVLYHLGVSFGNNFWEDFYEAKWLSSELRKWWDEPNLTVTNSSEERTTIFKQWIASVWNRQSQFLGVKHPLLSLCGQEIKEAFGANTKFVRSHRPLADSIASLARRKWWPEQESELQTQLWDSCETFFAETEHLAVDFDDLKSDPRAMIETIVEYIGLQPTDQQIVTAITSVKSDKISANE